MKKKETNIHINQLEAFQIEQSHKYSRILKGIKKKSIENPKYYFDNFISILSDFNFLMNCYENLKKNKGALTKGTDEETADKISEERIKRISTKIKENTFKFSPSRRILILKPGKLTMRPLTISNFDDRIVQEGIRIILENI